MPIKGQTDTPRPAGSGLPLIATLRKGGEKVEGSNKPGPDLTYFRVDFEPQFASLLGVFQSIYGNEPTTFPNVLLLQDDVDSVFPNWKEMWNGSRTLLRRCDGEQQIRRYEQGQYNNTPAPCVFPNCECKPMGRLTFMLGDFLAATSVLGVFTIVTHSGEDIRRIFNFLNDTKAIAGHLLNLPLVLGRAPQETTAPDYRNKGQRIKVTKSLLWMSIMPEATKDVVVARLAGGSFALTRTIDMPSLPASAAARTVDELDDQSSDADVDPDLNGTDSNLPDPDLGSDAKLRTRFFEFVHAQNGMGNRQAMQALQTKGIKILKGITVTQALFELGLPTDNYAEILVDNEPSF